MRSDRKVNLVNVTGEHVIGLRAGDRFIDIPYSKQCARVNFHQDMVELVEIDEGLEVPLYRNKDGIVKGLPGPVPGTLYIASRLVMEFVKRPDVVCPNKAPGHVFRDAFGKPLYTDSFIECSKHL